MSGQAASHSKKNRTPHTMNAVAGQTSVACDHHDRAGFTLMELLVVIAVIVLLAALAIPSFSMVRENADKAKCIGNLKQLASLTLTMASDNNGKIPGWTENKGGPWHWDEVRRFMGTPIDTPLKNSIFQCPATCRNPELCKELDITSGEFPIGRGHYRFNNFYAAGKRPLYKASEAVLFWDFTYSYTPNAMWSHKRGSSNPAMNLAYADSHVGTASAQDLRSGDRSKGIAPLYPLGGNDYTARLYRLGWVLEK
jgi:prepilin-type N-terminal cleavage/methylation domain-containing protein